MSTTIRATFDGTVLRPEQPADLKADTTYIVTIERAITPELDKDEEPYPLTQLREIAIDMGVDDFAANHDYYAHGLIPDEPDGR